MTFCIKVKSCNESWKIVIHLKKKRVILAMAPKGLEWPNQANLLPQVTVGMMVISSTIKIITKSSGIGGRCIGKCILIHGSRHIVRPIFSAGPMVMTLTHKGCLTRMVMTISLTMVMMRMVSWIGIPIFPTRIVVFPILVKHACSAWFAWRLSSSASFG